MVNHAVPTEKLCVPFGLHPVVERVSIFNHLYSTTQAAHRQDDFPNFGTNNSKPTLLENSLEQLNIRYKLIIAIHTKAQDFNGLNISFQYIRCRNSRNLIYAFLKMLTQKHITMFRQVQLSLLFDSVFHRFFDTTITHAQMIDISSPEK